MIPPRRYPHPFPSKSVNVTLYKEKGFANMIKSKILRRGDYLGLPRQTPNAITYIVIKGRKRKIRNTQRRRGDMRLD